MNKVVLFSTRNIGKDEGLFNKECIAPAKLQKGDFIFDYFDEKDKDAYNLCLLEDDLKNFLSKKGLYEEKYNSKNFYSTVVEISEDRKDIPSDEVSLRIGNYFGEFDSFASKYKASDYHLQPNIGIEIDKKEDYSKRFSLYNHIQNNKDIAFHAIYTLGRPEKKNNTNDKLKENKYIKALIQQLHKLHGEDIAITLLLHDKDIYSKTCPFMPLITEERLNIAIFNHTPGDPINDILNKATSNLSVTYDAIEAVFRKRSKMLNDANILHNVYEKLINNNHVTE